MRISILVDMTPEDTADIASGINALGKWLLDRGGRWAEVEQISEARGK